MKSFAAINEPRVAKALSHPLRARILGILEERRALLNLKLIKLVKKTPRRGAIEHHYEATGSAARVPDVEWEKMPSVAKQAIVGAVLDETNQSVAEAAATGGFDRSEAHITRTKLVLDDKGFKDLSEVLAKVVERAERIQEQSAKRLKASDHNGERQAALALMLFETMPPVERMLDSRGSKPAKRASAARA
jgi:hypothetical protein